MKYLLTLPIKLYQVFISPWFGRNCRYFPTCSHYTKEAIETHGFVKGGALALRRISSCHPWSKKDIDDPVPKRFAWGRVFGYKNDLKNK